MKTNIGLIVSLLLAFITVSCNEAPDKTAQAPVAEQIKQEVKDTTASALKSDLPKQDTIKTIEKKAPVSAEPTAKKEKIKATRYAEIEVVEEEPYLYDDIRVGGYYQDGLSEEGLTVVQAPPSSSDEPVTFASQMPAYPGGDAQMMKDIQANITYPPFEKENNIQGVVYVQFIVERDGTIKPENVTIQRGVTGGANLNKAAVAAIKKLKTFSPAMQNGKPTRLQMSLPVRFAIPKEEATKE